jgi:Cwf15/Cwc15 cell cycle control protein
VTEAEREAEIATANPLLNLAAALGNAPGINTTAPGTFAVKRRWDDGALLHMISFWYRFWTMNGRISVRFASLADLIFKNQAANDKEGGRFVNDLLRTEFHKWVHHPSSIRCSISFLYFVQKIHVTLYQVAHSTHLYMYSIFVYITHLLHHSSRVSIPPLIGAFSGSAV